MKNLSLIKIRITHKGSGLPAAGYTVDVIEKVFDTEEEKTADANGDIKPFLLDVNDFVYVLVFVRDEKDDMVVEADSQYPLVLPETVINILV